jgi:hypothetical protein
MSQIVSRKPTMFQFTETEQKIVNILIDGRSHHREELRACIDGEFTALVTMQNHLKNMRKKLRPKGQDIICEFVNRQLHYRWVRLLANPYHD